MFNNPKILVFTDFNEISDYVLKSAEVFRRNVGGEIHIVHIGNIPNSLSLIKYETNFMIENESIRKEYIKVINRQMSDQMQRCEVVATSDIIFDNISTGMKNYIKNSEYSISFIGHKSLSNNLFNLGGIASKIIASSPIPIMVIKKPLTHHLRKIGALVDTTEPMEKIIVATEELSFQFLATPVIISVWRTYSNALRKILSLEGKNNTFQFMNNEKEVISDWMNQQIDINIDKNIVHDVITKVTSKKKITAKLLEILEEEKIDLAVVMRHHHKILNNIFIGSECRRLLEKFPGNILVLPAKSV